MESEYQKHLEMIAEVGRLAGVEAENTGGDVMCFIFPIKDQRELIFGYADVCFGWTLWDHATSESVEAGNIGKEDATPQEQAEYMKQIVAKFAA